jgi:aflatoxin B1 aldehyde reductase
MSPTPKIVFGTASIGDRITGASAQEALDLFHAHGHVEIDTAAVYPPPNPGASESEIGQIHPDWAAVSTKVMPGVERANSREKLQQSLTSSLEKLNGLDVDILYFHAPDAATPMDEQAKAMDEASREGKFKRFGISNFSPEQVEELVGIAGREGEWFAFCPIWYCRFCSRSEIWLLTGYVKPSVYQGQYNLLARKGEVDLLPVLRKHGIAYYAYSWVMMTAELSIAFNRDAYLKLPSPAAAGMLTGKVSRENSKDSSSRWYTEHMGGQIYSASKFASPGRRWFCWQLSGYHKPAIFTASQKIQDAAKAHNLSGHAVALRWCIHHSALSGEHGDAIIVGASSLDQLKENLEVCDAGPLPEEVVQTIDGIWPEVRDVAPWAYLAQL